MTRESQMFQNRSPIHPGPIRPHKAGKMASRSYIHIDEHGHKVRRWHTEGLSKQDQKSLQGITKV